MEIKFTKGKWYCDIPNDLKNVENKFKAIKIGFNDEHTQGILGFVSTVLMPLDEPEANAKLISAAPDLLFALLVLVNDNRNKLHHIDKKEALKAIKKATE